MILILILLDNVHPRRKFRKFNNFRAPWFLISFSSILWSILATKIIYPIIFKIGIFLLSAQIWDFIAISSFKISRLRQIIAFYPLLRNNNNQGLQLLNLLIMSISLLILTFMLKYFYSNRARQPFTRERSIK